MLFFSIFSSLHNFFDPVAVCRRWVLGGPAVQGTIVQINFCSLN
jgi:hypothetical protein